LNKTVSAAQINTTARQMTRTIINVDLKEHKSHCIIEELTSICLEELRKTRTILRSGWLFCMAKIHTGISKYQLIHEDWW